MNKKLIYISLTVVIAIILGMALLVYLLFPKTAFVDINYIYNEFEYKKEMEKKLFTIQEQRQFFLDSLKMQLSGIAEQVKKDKNNTLLKEKFELKKENYLLNEGRFNDEYKRLQNEYTSQIIQQINQYIKDYGEKYNYTYIFGANSNGTLMFAKQNENISEKVLVYINERYLGE